MALKIGDKVKVRNHGSSYYEQTGVVIEIEGPVIPFHVSFTLTEHTFFEERELRLCD